MDSYFALKYKIVLIKDLKIGYIALLSMGF
jgi:hypothetical protein